jgi:hypothetical protein
MSQDVIIYVKVTLVGCDTAWGPAGAAPHADGTYSILSLSLTAGDQPEFNVGDRVICRPFELTDHDVILVAHRRAPAGKEPA